MSNVFADRLRTARELRKLSQSELAEKADLQPSAVSHFETGRRAPSFQNLKALSDALKVTTDFLIGRSDDMNVSNAVAIKLLRHAEKMSGEDLETITRMAEMMAKKQTKKE
jgi:ribosome-binding protein aMBF1 (putative translation factor)